MITREHADKIVRKLKATVRSSGGAHDIAHVYLEGDLVAQFGIRRSSRKDTGHGHLVQELQFSAHHVLRLANCPMSYEEWVERMKERRFVEREEEAVS